MKENRYRWVFLNFPKNLSSEQKQAIENIKLRLAKFYIEFKPFFSQKTQITFHSSYPKKTTKFTVSIDFPYGHSFQDKYKKRIFMAILKEINFLKDEMQEKLNIDKVHIGEGVLDNHKNYVSNENDKLDIVPTFPKWSFDNIILPEDVKINIDRVLSFVKNKKKIFEEWGIDKIYPNPKMVISLSGPPGTGKTITSHAIANHLNAKIIEVSYAQVESKYLGEGPKNLRKIFEIGQQENVVLFFDEADSLLGKRIRNVTEGAEQAINSMRSQMLIEIDRFSGVAIFATNLAENYDFGFDSRLVHVQFTLPDIQAREDLLSLFLVKELPGKKDVDIKKLAQETSSFSGRDLRDLVLFSAMEMARTDNLNLNKQIFDMIPIVKDGRSSIQK